MNKQLIVKDNRLIEASYRLDLAEQRLILLAMTRARESGVEITPEQWLEVEGKDFARVFAVTHSQAYRILKSTAESLFKRQVSLHALDEKTQKESVLITRWVSACTYIDHAGMIRLQFTPVIIRYLSNLEKCFTSYQLKNVAQMSSTYSIRLYELMTQYKSLGQRHLALAEIKMLLGATEKSYDKISNFKNKVLDVAVEQINQFTDLQVTYTPKKMGREIVGYDFVIDRKDQQPNPTIQNLPTEREPLKRSPEISYGLSTAERALLRDKQRTHPELQLSEESVIGLARQYNMDVYLFLASLK